MPISKFWNSENGPCRVVHFSVTDVVVEIYRRYCYNYLKENVRDDPKFLDR